MDWSRLRGAVFDALLVTFALGAALAPPDPFTQLLYAGPTLVVTLLVLHRYREPAGRWWTRYAIFVGGVLSGALTWRLLALAAGPSVAGVRPALLVAGVGLGAWLAFFDGATRLRGGVDA